MSYLRALPTIDDFERIGEDIFGSSSDPRVKKLKKSLQYYQSANQEGYVKKNKSKQKKKAKSHIQAENDVPAQHKEAKSKETPQGSKSKSAANDLVERIALDFAELDLNEAISEATKAMQKGEDDGGRDSREESSEPAGCLEVADNIPTPDPSKEDDSNDQEYEEKKDSGKKDAGTALIEALARGVDVKASEDGKVSYRFVLCASYLTQPVPLVLHLQYPTKQKSVTERPKSISIPFIHPDILKTALERHRQAQMSPYIYQLLTKGEIKLPVLLEDVDGKSTDIPPLHKLYQPLRQSLYAILFNLNHHHYQRKEVENGIKAQRRKADEFRRLAKKADDEAEKKELISKAEQCVKVAAETKVPDKPEVRVREWVPYNNYTLPDVVEANEIHWSVPTLQRLWFG